MTPKVNSCGHENAYVIFLIFVNLGQRSLIVVFSRVHVESQHKPSVTQLDSRNSSHIQHTLLLECLKDSLSIGGSSYIRSEDHWRNERGTWGRSTIEVELMAQDKCLVSM